MSVKENSDPGRKKERPAGYEKMPLRVVLIYAAAGACWILLSDLAVSLLFSDPAAAARAQTLKGWLFVVTTVALLYFLIRRHVAGVNKALYALQESREEFHTLVEKTASAVFIYRDTFLLVNAATEKLTGYTREELRALRFDEILHPDSREKLRAHCGAFLKGEAAPLNCELKILAKDGSTRWADFSARVITYQGSSAGLGTASDITEIKHLGEKLWQVSETFRSLVQASPLAIFVLDLEGAVRFWNPAAERILGWTEAEVLGLPNPIVPEEKAEEFHRLRSRVLQGEVFTDLELRRRRKDGAMIDVSLSTGPLRDRQGAISGTVVVVADISDRKRAEAGLLAAEARFRILVEQALVAIYMIRRGRFIYANPRFEEIFGYTADEVLALPAVLDLVADEDKGTVAENVRKRIEGETRSVRYTFKGRRKDGRLIDVEVYGASVDLDGERGIIGVLVDVTERTRAEKDLRESEERYRVIAGTASDAIITIDEDNTIVFVNQAVMEVFGYGPEEMVGLPVTVLIPPRLREGHLRGMREYIASGLRKAGWRARELPGLHKSGHEIPLEISYGEFTMQGRRFFTGVIRDITERKLAEKEKEYKDMLERFSQELQALVAERTIGLLALRLADRVRNPAAVIGWSAKRLLKKGDLPEAGREGLMTVVEETEKLEGTVKDFQALLQRKDPVFDYDDFNGVVRNVLAIIEKEALSRRVRVEARLSEGPLMMNMQAETLRTAVFIMFRNAVEASVEEGVVTVTTEERNGEILLSVSDSGRGIPGKLLDKIFDPFYGAQIERYGLGWPLVKQIASEHLGRVDIRSEWGKGTTCVALFPKRWIGSGTGQ